MSVKTIIQVIFIQTVFAYYKERCPEYMEKQIMSKFCPVTQPLHCLFEDNLHTFVRKCRNWEWVGEGYYPQLSGKYIDYGDCHHNMYQPLTFPSNENHQCLYHKSLCNEKGQVPGDDGTTKTDRTCLCDYRKGYNYVTEPTRHFCKPSEEDCSCYYKQCGPNEILDEGFNCVHKIGVHQTDNSGKRPTTKEQSYMENRTPFNWEKITLMGCIAVTIFLCMIFIIVLLCKDIPSSDFNSIHLSTGQNMNESPSEKYAQVKLDVGNSSAVRYENKAENVKSTIPDVGNSSAVRYENKAENVKSTIPEYAYLPERAALNKSKQQEAMSSTVTSGLTIGETMENIASYSADIDVDFILPCMVVSMKPIKTVKWTKTFPESKEISIDYYKYSDGSVINPSLKISKIKDSDFGIYSCVVRFNDSTEQHSKYKLTIKDKRKDDIQFETDLMVINFEGKDSKSALQFKEHIEMKCRENGMNWIRVKFFEEVFPEYLSKSKPIALPDMEKKCKYILIHITRDNIKSGLRRLNISETTLLYAVKSPDSFPYIKLICDCPDYDYPEHHPIFLNYFKYKNSKQTKIYDSTLLLFLLKI